MNRIIRCNVENEFIRGAGVVIGAAGSHDDVELELTFSPVWDGTSKKIVWFDALGEQTVVTVLGVNLLVPGEERRYRVSVPWEAKAVEGDMKLTIRGANVSGNKETRAVVAATACFKVLPALWDPLAVESNEPSADVSDQLQQEIEDIMDDLTLAVAAADAKQAAETSAAAAAGSAAAAAGSASEAQFCANSASIAEDNAKDYMLTCGAYAEEVQTNSAAAAGSATAAAASARSAASSASEAASSASWADRSASRADISATEAAKSAAAAASSASAAASVELNSRKINGKPLSADVILSAGDVGAISGSGAFSSAAIAAPYTLKVESAPGDSWGIGQYWTAHDLPLTLNWTGVAFGFDALTEMSRFVAVAEGSAQAVYSDDGITWNTASLPSSASWQSIAYGGGKFVAVANGSNQAAYSNNGITWNTASLPDASDWQSVAYGGGKFVAVANGSNQAACSEDGVTWTAATLPETDYWKTVTYGACRFVAVADPSNRAAWSADGVHWQLAQLPSLAGWNCLAYGAGKFLAISSTLRAASSPDGENWSYANPPGDSSHMAWMALTYACGVFVAVENGNKAAWSTDGESWRLAGLPSSGEWRALAFGQDTLVTLAHNSNKLARCSDRSLWFNVNGKLTGGGVTRKDIGGVEKSAAAMSETICRSILAQTAGGGGSGGADLGDSTPAMDGTAAAGTASTAARSDHVHPTDTSRVPTTRKVNNKTLSSDITLTAADVGALSIDGTAYAARKLATLRTIRTKLSDHTAVGFDGTDDVTPGVTGTLGIANGGTGSTTAVGALANLGADSRYLQLNGGDMTGMLDMNGNALTGLPDPVSPTDAVNYQFMLDTIMNLVGVIQTEAILFSSDGSSTLNMVITLGLKKVATTGGFIVFSLSTSGNVLSSTYGYNKVTIKYPSGFGHPGTGWSEIGYGGPKFTYGNSTPINVYLSPDSDGYSYSLGNPFTSGSYGFSGYIIVKVK